MPDMYTKHGTKSDKKHAAVLLFVCLSVCRQRVVVGHWLTGACAAAGGRRDVGTPEQRVSQIFFPREKTLP